MLTVPDINPKAVLKIPDAQYKKLYSYIDACDTEVGGIATVKQIDDVTFEVDKVFITRQTAHGTYLRLEDKDLLRVKNELSKQFITESTNKLVELGKKEKVSIADIVNYTQYVNENKGKNKLILQWHSHVNMGTFASGTDRQTALRLSLGNPYYFMLIMNKQHANTCYLMMRSPIGSWEEIDTEFNKEINIDDIKAEALADIAKNVFPHEKFRVNEQTGIIEPHVYNPAEILETEDYQPPQFMERTYGYFKRYERKAKPTVYGQHYEHWDKQNRDFWAD